jgi:hypothetical protein
MSNNKRSPTVTSCSFIGNTAIIPDGVVDFKDVAILCGNWPATP